jgi:hypothetical protein
MPLEPLPQSVMQMLFSTPFPLWATSEHHKFLRPLSGRCISIENFLVEEFKLVTDALVSNLKIVSGSIEFSVGGHRCERTD